MLELVLIKKEVSTINLLVDNLIKCKRPEDMVRVVLLLIVHIAYLEHLFRLIIKFVQSIIDYYFTRIPRLKIKETLLITDGRETNYIKKQ